MASAAEQLAANLNLGAFAKATELKKRIWFTLAALIVYRLGTWIPVPGVDPHVLAEMFRRSGGGILGMFDMFAGGALQRMTIFALNIMPYISASIIMQLMTTVVPTLESPQEGGRAGPQEDQSVHPLRHRGYCRRPGLWYRGRSRRHVWAWWRSGVRSRAVLPLYHGDHAGRRNHVPDVAGRADHRPRRRQRYFADHLRRHRRQSSPCYRQHPGIGTYRRAVGRLDHFPHHHGDWRRRAHRVRRACPTTHYHPVSEAPGGE